MIEDVHSHYQPATRELADHHRVKGHIKDPGSVSAAGRLGTQQCMARSALASGGPYCWAQDNLHPCSLGHFVPELTGQWQEGHWGKRLTGPQEGLLSTWLLKSSFAKVILWWPFTWHTNIFRFYPFKDIYPHTNSQNFLVTNIPTMFPPGALPPSETSRHSPGICI